MVYIPMSILYRLGTYSDEWKTYYQISKVYPLKNSKIKWITV